MNFPQISNKTAALALTGGALAAGMGYAAVSGDLSAVTSAASKALLGFSEEVASSSYAGVSGMLGYTDTITHDGLLTPAMNFFSSLLA